MQFDSSSSSFAHTDPQLQTVVDVMLEFSMIACAVGLASSVLVYVEALRQRLFALTLSRLCIIRVFYLKTWREGSRLLALGMGVLALVTGLFSAGCWCPSHRQ